MPTFQILSNFPGLQMLLLMKPRITLPYSDNSTLYSLGISTTLNSMDQKLNIIDLEPGLHTVVSVTPQFIETTEEFDELPAYTRNCRLPHETARLKSFKNYSRTACEHECAFMKAVDLCKCAPWYYKNETSNVTICETFGGFCFNKIMSTRKYYKACPDECLEDCNGIQLSWEKSFRPINRKKICRKGSVLYEFLKKTERQHFSQNYYNSWKLATEDYTQFEKIDKIMKDGDMSDHYVAQCEQFVEKYIAVVTVETPTNVITLIQRDEKASFLEKMGILGGQIGLFTGFSIMSILDILRSMYQMIWPQENMLSDKDIRLKMKKMKQKKHNKGETVSDIKPGHRRFELLQRKVDQQGKKMEQQEREIKTLKMEMKTLKSVC